MEKQELEKKNYREDGRADAGDVVRVWREGRPRKHSGNRAGLIKQTQDSRERENQAGEEQNKKTGGKTEHWKKTKDSTKTENAHTEQRYRTMTAGGEYSAAAKESFWALKHLDLF